MIRQFGIDEFMFLLTGAKWTLALSAIAFAGGCIGGLIIALMRTSSIRSVSRLANAFIELFRGTPLLMQLFLVYFGLALVGMPLDVWVAAGIALTLHASAFLGEIWRGCIEAVPRGQWEAANALALRYSTRMCFVILPQALRISLSSTVGFLVQLIKGTSLAAIIGFTELTRSGQILSGVTYRPLLIFSIIACIYFVICWPLSLYSARLERIYERAR
jgi:polar amino acid transport system permease protein